MDTYSDALRDWLSQDGASGPRPQRPPQTTSIPMQPQRFFAFVIGIDEYAASGSKKFKNLKGAVKDAGSITSYLINDLQVPPFNILYLDNQNATYSAIMKNFDILEQTNIIHSGDPILFYFAGHGMEKLDTLEGDDRMIQMIIPYDYGMWSPSDRRYVEGIYGRIFNRRLQQLATAKGDNITVILDCCYAAAGTCDLPPTPNIENGDRVRGIKIDEDILPDLDKHIWDDPTIIATIRGSSCPEDFLYSGFRSHVLLAACGAKETAWEHQNGGFFTKALIRELIETRGNVTYCDLILRIPCTPHQTPQCEGLNKDRMLWNSKVRDTGLGLFNVEIDGGKYKLNAGMTDAITDKAEFNIYETMDDYNKNLSLGTFVVESIDIFTSTLVIKGTEDEPMLSQCSALALQTKVGIKKELCLHVADSTLALVVRTELKRERFTSNPRRILLGSVDTARLSLTTEQGFIVFDILDSFVISHRLTRMPFRIKPQWLGQVIQGAAHFDWHLRHGIGDSAESVTEKGTRQGGVKLEFRKVAKVEGRPTVVGPNLHAYGHIDLVAGEDTYGAKLVNNSELPLYPYLFFFDYSDLSIQLYYESPMAHESTSGAPLQPKSEFTINYSDGGWSRWRYKVRDPESIIPDEIEQDKQDIDVGFLKIFLSTKPVKLSYLRQTTPFARDFQPCSRKTEVEPFEAVGIWRTKLITIVQRRRLTELTTVAQRQEPADVPMDVD